MYSYSYFAKKELCKIQYTNNCCELALLAGIILFAGVVELDKIRIVTENKYVASLSAQLFKSIFGIDATVKEDRLCFVEITNREEIVQVLLSLHLMNPENKKLISFRISSMFTANECCRKAFLRGAFLSGGTIINPQKNYHFEIVTHYLRLSEDLQSLMTDCGFPCKKIVRKSNYVIYIKESDEISDILAFLGAFKAQIKLLNVKIEREWKNDVNRTTNCEAANLGKTIDASVRQIKAIREIEKHFGLDSLPVDLREVAVLRLDNPEASISDLSRRLTTPLTKSGLNHRLKKIINIAEKFE